MLLYFEASIDRLRMVNSSLVSEAFTKQAAQIAKYTAKPGQGSGIARKCFDWAPLRLFDQPGALSFCEQLLLAHTNKILMK